MESLRRDSGIHIAGSLLCCWVILVRGRWLRNMIWVATTRHLRGEVMIYIDIVIMILLNIVFLVYIICIHLWSRSLSLWYICYRVNVLLLIHKEQVLLVVSSILSQLIYINDFVISNLEDNLIHVWFWELFPIRKSIWLLMVTLLRMLLVSLTLISKLLLLSLWFLKSELLK